MYKIIGFAFIVAASGLLGFTKRNEAGEAQKICGQIHEFLCEISQCIELKFQSLPDFLIRASASERYAMLEFLGDACTKIEDGESLRKALIVSLKEWDKSRLLSRDEVEELIGAFYTLGEGNAAQEALKLIPVTEFFKARAEERKLQNEKKRGMYETVYALVGAAVAIVLV